MLHVPNATLLQRLRQLQRPLLPLPHQHELVQLRPRRHPLQQTPHEVPQDCEDRRRHHTRELGILSLAPEHVDDASLRHVHSHRVQTLHYASREPFTTTFQDIAVLHVAFTETTIARKNERWRDTANEHVTAHLLLIGLVA